MNNFKKTTLVVAITYALSGCTLFGETKTAEEDQGQTRAQGAIFGALAGTIAGVLIGDSKKGAAIGAIVGTMAGTVLGDMIANRKGQYASAEEAIAEETRRTEQLTQAVRTENSQLKQDILTYDKQIVMLRADINKGKKNYSSLKTQKNKMQARHDSAKKSLSAVENELKVSQGLYQDYKSNSTASTSSELQTWQKKISKLKKEKSELEKNIQTLNAMNSKL